MGAASWPQGDAAEFAVPVEVSSLTDSPASLTFRLWDMRFPFHIYRKEPAALDWGEPVALVAAGLAHWTDATIASGVLYHYRFHQLRPEGEGAFAFLDAHVNAYCLAGVRVDRTQPQGRVILVMPASIQDPLQDELAQFVEDLTAEGWFVHTVLSPDGADQYAQDPRNNAHLPIRDQIRALYAAFPSEVKHVILLGRVPVARSGSGSPFWRPDGHGILGANAADAWYADVDNPWSDLATLDPKGAYDLRSEWRNFPDDGRWDQLHFTELSSAFEMGWGRIDFRQPLAYRSSGSEIAALRTYLQKLHRYKTAAEDFRPGRKAIGRAGFNHNDEDFAREITPLTGMANMDFVTRNDWQLTAPGDPDAEFSNVHGPAFFYMKGDMAPSLNSTLSRAVIWCGWQSHFGYWDIDWNMAARISEPDSFTLAWTWNARGLRYAWHLLGMGNCLGDVMRGSINNQHYVTGLVGSRTDRITNSYQGWLFMNLLGDPTIRLFPVKPVSGLTASLNPVTLCAALSWIASPEASAGYHVYAANQLTGPYLRLTHDPVFPNVREGTLSWDAPNPLTAERHFMVRAVHLQASGGGSFLNPSIGVLTHVVPPPTSFAAWQASIDWSGADSRADADPDDDRYPNLLEYALGINPLLRNSPQDYPALQIEFTSDTAPLLSIAFNVAARDVQLIAEAAVDLSTWCVLNLQAAIADPSALATGRINVALPWNSERAVFVRLRATLQVPD